MPKKPEKKFSLRNVHMLLLSRMLAIITRQHILSVFFKKDHFSNVTVLKYEKLTDISCTKVGRKICGQ